MPTAEALKEETDRLARLKEHPHHPLFRYRCMVNDRIEAAHQLKLPYESKCNRAHGHSYRLQAIVESPRLLDGMVVDFSFLKGVFRKYDHQNLNEFFEPSTAEKFAEILFDELQDVVKAHNPLATVVEVGVGETETTWVSVQYSGR
jgi:6-pyruvoyltetrahydropterin/6-carboxytetrahydropterin synthase